MGCCMSLSSTNTEAPAGSAPEKHVGSIEEASLKLSGFSHETRVPPPSVEEETVKEVLSEIPKPKSLPNQEPIFTAEMKQDLLEEGEEEEAKIFSAHKVEAFGKIQEKQNLGSNEEIMSEGSEICSVSISESVSTVTNVTDKRDNDEEEEEEEQEVRQRQRVMSKSPAKPPPTRNGFKRDRVMNQSPARRIGNNKGSAVKGCPGRRDPRENFRRRSRSPATATRSSAAVGQSPSTRRVDRSPGRFRSGPIENSSNGTTRTNSCRTREGRWASNNDDNNNNNDNWGTNETLENPLVSLECFIFL